MPAVLELSVVAVLRLEALLLDAPRRCVLEGACCAWPVVHAVLSCAWRAVLWLDIARCMPHSVSTKFIQRSITECQPVAPVRVAR
jgi:hypothetical protein